MRKPTPEELKEATEALYGEYSEPVIRAIETREHWKKIKQRFEELKQKHKYKTCVRLLVKEFNASQSLVKKSIHKKFPSDEQ